MVRNVCARQVANYSRFSAVAVFTVRSSLIGPAILGGDLGVAGPLGARPRLPGKEGATPATKATGKTKVRPPGN
jgi:hypothetical protein